MNNAKAISHKLAMSLLSKLQKRQKDLSARRGMSIYITSAARGEGKTFVAEALARNIAGLSGNRVLLVDSNMESPRLHRRFGLNLGNGLSDGILHDKWDDTQVRQTDIPEMQVVTVGSRPSAGLLFRYKRVARFLDIVTKQYDLIFLDGSSLAETGANSLAYLADGIIVVIDGLRTKREVIRNALSEVKVEPAHFLGVVLNKKPYYIPGLIYRFL